MRISMRFTFEAAHYLTKVSDGHKCKRPHGHSYWVEIICEGELDERGMVCDYAEIEQAWEPIFLSIDHRCLNDVDGLDNPTTENVAAMILRTAHMALPCVKAVRVGETAREMCEVSL
jgi:6-pyruvoyltetrahydropterin/6-carboxytetrahydropterin synthase